MAIKIKIVFFALLMCVSIKGIAQTPADKAEVTKKHSPKKAGIYSACIPGWGQGYNRKYWKIPIVWAGFTATGLMIYQNASTMNEAYDAYMWVDEGAVGNPPNELASQYGNSINKIESIYNEYRHQVELFTVITVAWYFVNIIDAVVDAHFTNFDVSDNLSINIQPPAPITHPFQSTNYYTGIAVNIRF